MKKITQQSVTAFLNHRKFKSGNMEVVVDNGTTKMYLHNNCIAKNVLGKISISNCGWTYPTTKERLNGIFEELNRCSDKIYQKNYSWYWKDDIDFPAGGYVLIN